MVHWFVNTHATHHGLRRVLQAGGTAVVALTNQGFIPGLPNLLAGYNKKQEVSFDNCVSMTMLNNFICSTI